MAYYSGQGKLLVATTTDGTPGGFRWVGNCSAVTFELSTETLEHQESYSGQRLTDLRLTTSKTASLSATLEEVTAENLAMGLYGSPAATTSSTVSNEELPSGLKEGDIVRLAHPNVSSLTINRKTSGTLTLGTDYEIHSASHGSIRLLTTPTEDSQPLKVSYTYGAYNNVTMFSSSPPELWVRFEGLNTASADAPVLIEFYRTRFDPLASFPVIGDELGAMELSGSALFDQSKDNDAALGGFGRIVQV